MTARANNHETALLLCAKHQRIHHRKENPTSAAKNANLRQPTGLTPQWGTYRRPGEPTFSFTRGVHRIFLSFSLRSFSLSFSSPSFRNRPLSHGGRLPVWIDKKCLYELIKVSGQRHTPAHDRDPHQSGFRGLTDRLGFVFAERIASTMVKSKPFKYGERFEPEKQDH